LKKQDQNLPEFLKLNPKHKVPLLIVDGVPLSENIAIQLWIASNFPDANLMPRDRWQELEAISMLSWFASGFHPHLSRINSPGKFCDKAEAEESVIRIGKEFLIEQFKIAEARLSGRDYFFDHFTTVDAYFFWCVRRAQMLNVNLASFKSCQAHFITMNKRQSVQNVLSFEVDAKRRLANSESMQNCAP